MELKLKGKIVKEKYAQTETSKMRVSCHNYSTLKNYSKCEFLHDRKKVP